MTHELLVGFIDLLNLLTCWTHVLHIPDWSLRYALQQTYTSAGFIFCFYAFQTSWSRGIYGLSFLCILRIASAVLKKKKGKRRMHL